MTTIVISPTLDDCRWAVADFNSALPRAREPLRARISRFLDGAIAERHKAEATLRTKWSWLDNQPGHPHFDEGETVAIESLEAYGRWCDVVQQMCRALGDTRDRCVG